MTTILALNRLAIAASLVLSTGYTIFVETPPATATPQLTATPTATPTQLPDIIVQPGESIQDALDRAQPGQTVHLLAGEYEGVPGEALHLKPGVRLVGAGIGKTIYHPTVGPCPPPPVPAAACWLSQPAAVAGADGATIERMTIEAFKFGLNLPGVTGMTVRGIEVSAGLVALGLSNGATGNVIEGNIVNADLFGENSLQVSSSHRNTFRNNQFLGQTEITDSSGNEFTGDLFRGRPREESPREALVLNESSGNRFDRATFYAKFWRTIRVFDDEGGNVISNSIIAGGEEESRMVVVRGPSPLFEWTLVDHKLFDVYDGQIVMGEGVIVGDPGFKNPDEDNYNLQSDSPAIDAGNPASERDPDGTRADLGAYWFDQRPELVVSGDRPVRVQVGEPLVLWIDASDPQSEPVSVGFVAEPPLDVRIIRRGDVREDGELTSVDATIILQHEADLLALEDFQQTLVDLNEDGRVDTLDATLVLQVHAGLLAPPNTWLLVLEKAMEEHIGVYDVTLQAVNEDGLTSTETVRIIVEEPVETEAVAGAAPTGPGAIAVPMAPDELARERGLPLLEVYRIVQDEALRELNAE